jgi:hypothetical protein
VHPFLKFQSHLSNFSTNEADIGRQQFTSQQQANDILFAIKETHFMIGTYLAAFHAAFSMLTLDAALFGAIRAWLGLGVALSGAWVIAHQKLAARLDAGHMMG